jgi:hypothetical protein
VNQQSASPTPCDCPEQQPKQSPVNPKEQEADSGVKLLVPAGFEFSVSVSGLDKLRPLVLYSFLPMP